MARVLSASLLLILAAYANLVSADSWRFDPIKKDRVEIFGDSKIVLTTDARNNQKYPDYTLSIYKKDELRAMYRGVAFEDIFPSPDNTRFVGLSNRGLPGTAVIIFDNDGNLLLEVKHGVATFDYCDESITLVRRWYDEKHPDVKYVVDAKNGGYESVTVRDCRGKEQDLSLLISQAYDRSSKKWAARRTKP